MATFTLQQGARYRATISLGMVESLASNDMVASKLIEAGFSNVTVTGSGRQRLAEGTWPGPTQTGDVPSQVNGLQLLSSPLQAAPEGAPLPSSASPTLVPISPEIYVDGVHVIRDLS